MRKMFDNDKYIGIADQTLTFKNSIVWLVIRRHTNVVIGVYNDEEEADREIKDLGDKLVKKERRIINQSSYH